jgi:glucosamine--fructose-6-phosphate aminotransferase (isomerizing)
MCGIVAFVGTRAASPVLVEGLRKLEYRGYDSAGVAVHAGGDVAVVRAVGKLSNLDAALSKAPLSGSVGIGHTRWATHGRPSEANAHPHVSGPVAVVHNGIIENHVALRHELEADGVRFASDTDTEIVAHLVARALGAGAASLEEAVAQSLRRVTGAYAIAVLSKTEPDVIVLAKDQSPLVLGLGDGELIAASDIPAILSTTRDVVFLQDGEMAVLRRLPKGEAFTFEARLRTVAGEPVTRASKRIDWSPAQAEKGGFKHFMLKEIHEQPRAIEDTLRGRVDLEGGDVVSQELGLDDAVATSIDRVYFVACGTSAHAAMAGRYWVEALARVPATVEIGSEVRYRDPVFTPRDLVIAVSQSGETSDTLAAVKAARAGGARVLAIANVLDSAIPRTADGAFYTHAGPEIGVASTKCFTTQLAAMLLFAVWLGRRRGTLSVERAKTVLAALTHVPALMREVLESDASIRVLAKRHLKARDMLFLGRGVGFPIALEGALKVKEISYVHAEGYAAGEMKHGPIALIDDAMPVVVVCPRDDHFEKTASNLQEVRAREGQIIAIGTTGDEELANLVKKHEGDLVTIPASAPEVVHLLTVLPLQLLAYHMADLKGTDVDQPRNLAKTVTVE